jgi:hydroxypyruvate reductase/glycerate 2-kinase
MALSAARHAAIRAGLPTHILTSSLCGEAREVARVVVAIAESIRLHGDPFEPPVCLLLGGEPTVTVSGSGSGGRNQELALSALARIGSRAGILLISVGSDGIDGTTTAAGAVADAGYFLQGDALGLSIDDHLQANDSYHYWQQVGGLIVTGPTGTNVMDLVAVLIDRGIP